MAEIAYHVDVPKLGRFTGRITWASMEVLGCHTSSVYALADTYSPQEMTKWVFEPDGKDATIAKFFPKGAYHMVPPDKKEEFEELVGPYMKDAHNKMYKNVADTISNVPTFVIMSGPVNYNINPNKCRSSEVSVMEFVHWLIKNKYGVVTASPVATNKRHQDYTHHSMCQVWTWLPPNAKTLAVQGSGGTFNDESLPDYEQAIKHHENLWKKSDYTPVEMRTHDNFVKRMQWHRIPQ